MLSGDAGYEGSLYIGAIFGKNANDVWDQNDLMWELLGEKGYTIPGKIMQCVIMRDYKQLWYIEKLSYFPD